MFLPQYLHRSTLDVWHRSFIVRHLFSSLSFSLVRISSAHLLFIMAKISFAKINPVNGKSTFVDVSTWNEWERVGESGRERSPEKLIWELSSIKWKSNYFGSDLSSFVHFVAAFCCFLSRVSVFNNELHFIAHKPTQTHTHSQFADKWDYYVG